MYCFIFAMLSVFSIIIIIIINSGAIQVIMTDHKYTSNDTQTCKVAIEAGTDLDCGIFYGQNMLVRAYEKLRDTQTDTEREREIERAQW